MTGDGPPQKYNVKSSTYLGGSGGEHLCDTTVDAQGNIYVAGIAGSGDLPRNPGVIPGGTKMTADEYQESPNARPITIREQDPRCDRA